MCGLDIVIQRVRRYCVCLLLLVPSMPPRTFRLLPTTTNPQRATTVRAKRQAPARRHPRTAFAAPLPRRSGPGQPTASPRPTAEPSLFLLALDGSRPCWKRAPKRWRREETKDAAIVTRTRQIWRRERTVMMMGRDRENGRDINEGMGAQGA